MKHSLISGVGSEKFAKLVLYYFSSAVVEWSEKVSDEREKVGAEVVLFNVEVIVLDLIFLL